MKRILLLLALFPILSYAQNSQSDSIKKESKYKTIFKEVNKKTALGLGGGVAGLTTNYFTGAFSFNFTIMGYHFDFCGMGSGEDHKHDVRVDKWSNDYYTSFHFGYQIPITRNFRFIPLVGFWVAGVETTDGGDWTVSGGQIQNKTSSSRDAAGFDYGAQLNFKIKKVLYYGNITRYSACVGIGFEFGGKKK